MVKINRPFIPALGITLLLSAYFAPGLAWADEREDNQAAIQFAQENNATTIYSVNTGQGPQFFTDKAQADAYGAAGFNNFVKAETEKAVAGGYAVDINGQRYGHPEAVAGAARQDIVDANQGAQNLLDMQRAIASQQAFKKTARKMVLGSVGGLYEDDPIRKETIARQDEFEKEVDANTQEAVNRIIARPAPPRVLVALESNKEASQ